MISSRSSKPPVPIALCGAPTIVDSLHVEPWPECTSIEVEALAWLLACVLAPCLLACLLVCLPACLLLVACLTLVSSPEGSREAAGAGTVRRPELQATSCSRWRPQQCVTC